MKRYNAFRVNIDRTFLEDTLTVLNNVLNDFEDECRVSVESIDEVTEIRDTLSEVLNVEDQEDDF